jgi:archaellum component FlaC
MEPDIYFELDKIKDRLTETEESIRILSIETARNTELLSNINNTLSRLDKQLNRHIGFVDTVYDTVRKPANYILEKLSGTKLPVPTIQIEI